MALPHRLLIFLASEVRRRRDNQSHGVVGHVSMGVHVARIADPQLIAARVGGNLRVPADLWCREALVEGRGVVAPPAGSRRSWTWLCRPFVPECSSVMNLHRPLCHGGGRAGPRPDQKLGLVLGGVSTESTRDRWRVPLPIVPVDPG